MWIGKETLDMALKAAMAQYAELRLEAERLKTELEKLKAARQADALELESGRFALKVAQDRIAQLEGQPRVAKILPPPVPDWAKEVDWSRVEGAPEQL